MKTRQRYKCRNWRCTGNDGECAEYERRLMFARVREAIDRDGLAPDGWCFLVLTLDKLGTFSGRECWKDADAAFRDLSRMNRKFFDQLRAWMRKQGMRPLGREWIAVVEAHRSGWPHLNVLLWSPELAAYVEREQARLGSEFQRLGFHVATLPPELMGMARKADWGTLSTIERVKNENAVLNYLTKLAGEAGQAMNEIAKLTQLPLNAPLRFRRMRSGKGWLPNRRKNADVTGSLMARKFDRDDGSPLVFPMHKVKESFLIPHLAAICYEEARLWDRERENEPALRAARDALALPAIKDDTPAELIADLVQARREALAAVYREFSTPSVYSVTLPVKQEPAIVLSWPDAEPPEPQLDFHRHARVHDNPAETAGAKKRDKK